MSWETHQKHCYSTCKRIGNRHVYDLSATLHIYNTCVFIYLYICIGIYERSHNRKQMAQKTINPRIWEKRLSCTSKNIAVSLAYYMKQIIRKRTILKDQS